MKEKPITKLKDLTYYTLVCNCCNEPLTVLEDGHITIFRKKSDAIKARLDNYNTKDIKTLKTTLKIN